MLRTVPTAASLPTVVSDRGLNLLGTVLWFDAEARTELCFASSARLRRPGRHRKLVCSSATGTLFGLRDARLARRPRVLTGPFGQPFRLGPLTLELLPAGGLLGAAQLVVEHEGRRTLYVGALGPGAEAPTADLVVAAAPCRPPSSALPAPEERDARLLAFVDERLRAGESPLLLADALGPAQDLLALLVRHRVPVAVHRSVHRLLPAWVEAGRTALDDLPRLGRRLPSGRAVVFAARSLRPCAAPRGARGRPGVDWPRGAGLRGRCLPPRRAARARRSRRPRGRGRSPTGRLRRSRRRGAGRPRRGGGDPGLGVVAEWADVAGDSVASRPENAAVIDHVHDHDHDHEGPELPVGRRDPLDAHL